MFRKNIEKTDALKVPVTRHNATPASYDSVTSFQRPVSSPRWAFGLGRDQRLGAPSWKTGSKSTDLLLDP